LASGIDVVVGSTALGAARGASRAGGSGRQDVRNGDAVCGDLVRDVLCSCVAYLMDMGFNPRAEKASPAATESASVSASAPERRGHLDRAEALRRLDEVWGSLPQDSLDRARQRLGVNEGASPR
jgi:hypothetical protein